MERGRQGQEEVDGLRLHFGGKNNRTSGRLDVEGEEKAEMMCDSSLRNLHQSVGAVQP